MNMFQCFKKLKTNKSKESYTFIKYQKRKYKQYFLKLSQQKQIKNNKRNKYKSEAGSNDVVNKGPAVR